MEELFLKNDESDDKSKILFDLNITQKTKDIPVLVLSVLFLQVI